RVPKRSAAQPAGSQISGWETRPAAKTTPTSDAEPPLRPRKMGSSGRKTQPPMAFRKLTAYSVRRVRRSSMVNQEYWQSRDDRSIARCGMGPDAPRRLLSPHAHGARRSAARSRDRRPATAHDAAVAL